MNLFSFKSFVGAVTAAALTASGLAVAGDGAADALIEKVLGRWGPVIEGEGGTTDQLELALRRASGESLVEAAKAGSLGALDRAILGPTAGTAAGVLEGVEGPETLGSTTEDHVYTAVTPCRIVDTRTIGTIAAGGTASYLVYGGAAAIAAQGGNPAGCPSPRGEPRAAHLNFAVIPRLPAGAGGFLTAWPFSLPQPTASVVNYRQGVQNAIANAATIQTFYSGAATADISVFTSRTIHLVVDVLGYYHEVDPEDLARGNHAGFDIDTGLLTSSSYVWVDEALGGTGYDDDPSNGPAGTGDVLTLEDGSDVNVQVTMLVFPELPPVPGGSAAIIEGEITPCYRTPPDTGRVVRCQPEPPPPPPGDPSEGPEAETDFCFVSVPDPAGPTLPLKAYQHSVQASCIFRDLRAGTYDLGVCAKTGSDLGCGAQAGYFIGGVKVDLLKLPE